MSRGERQIEMTWRCATCAHKNLGRHMTCAGCGRPKDDAVEYEMPDVEAAPTVTDPALLRMAKAAPNWSCAYCGSDQRALDGACARCGAGRAEGANAAHAGPPRPPTPPRPARDAADVRALQARPVAWLIGLVAGIVALGVGGIGLAWCARGGDRAEVAVVAPPAPPPLDFDAQVTSIDWRQTVHVDRWTAIPGEGFAEAQPPDAIEVRSAGTRVHHQSQVPDGFDTQAYTETVPDGFDTQTYTERVACGQDCTPTPQSCRQECTSNKNGFATCRDVCTGGGQRCTTRYCDQPRTRQVPRTKTVTKTRQVPRYKSVPVSEPWFTWKVWGWKEARAVSVAGTTAETWWPTREQVAGDAGAQASDAKERERRDGVYRATVVDARGESHTLSLANADELARYPLGAWLVVRRAGGEAVVLPP